MASSLSTAARNASLISYPIWVVCRWLSDENVKQESEAVMFQGWLRGTLVAVAKRKGASYWHSAQRHTTHLQIETGGT